MWSCCCLPAFIACGAFIYPILNYFSNEFFSTNTAFVNCFCLDSSLGIKKIWVGHKFTFQYAIVSTGVLITKQTSSFVMPNVLFLDIAIQNLDNLMIKFPPRFFESMFLIHPCLHLNHMVCGLIGYTIFRL